MTDTFKDRLRDELLTGLPRRQRRQRRQRIGVAALAVVAVAGLGVAAVASGGEPSSDVRSGPGTTAATTAPATTAPTVPDAGPGGPGLAEGEAAEATRVVGELLSALRADDIDAATALWTGYPEVFAPKVREEAQAFMRRFRDDTAWLLADPEPTYTVTPSSSYGPPVPVVTVTVDLPNDDRRSAAFVMSTVSDAVGIRESAGPMLVNRLPASDEGVTPPQGAALTPGDLVNLPGIPVEGGARAFVNGVEVPAIVDYERMTTRVEVPAGTTGDMVLTVSSSSPEIPGATALWYPIAPAG